MHNWAGCSWKGPKLLATTRPISQEPNFHRIESSRIETKAKPQSCQLLKLSVAIRSYPIRPAFRRPTFLRGLAPSCKQLVLSARSSALGGGHRLTAMATMARHGFDVDL